jgi:hypothetical protein
VRPFILALVCALAAAAAPAAGSTASPSPVDLAVSITVPLYLHGTPSSRYCTAFFARPASVNRDTGRPYSAWFLTAGHCMLLSTPVRRPLPIAWEITAPMAASSIEGQDFGAFVSSDWRPSPIYLPFLSRPLRRGERVVATGYGDGQLRILTGTYTGTDPSSGALMIRTDQPVRGGMSGSPIVTMDGMIAGILVATTLDNGIEDPRAAVATPISVPVDFLTSHSPLFASPDVEAPASTR